tara:strand:- start:118 stop:654 length:537 start_codon:yes stop_codon:yes gene_type:complete
MMTMEGCKCHLGATNHEDTIKYNEKEIRRLRWTEPFKIAKPKVIALMEENISIKNCTGEDSTSLEVLLNEFQQKSAIRKGSQLGLRKIHPDVMGNRKNKGARRDPIEVSRERQRAKKRNKRQSADHAAKKNKKKIANLEKTIKRIQSHIADGGEWGGKYGFANLQKKLEKLKKKQKKN